MSLRLTTTPLSLYRGQWLSTRLQQTLIQTQTQTQTQPWLSVETSVFFFSTSAVSSSRISKPPRTHKQGLWPLKKIRKKATKGNFRDSISSTEAPFSGTSRGSKTYSESQQTIIPLETFNDHGIKYDARKRPNYRQDPQHKQQQQKTSRLQYEDFLPPRYQRQHLLHRQRWFYYLHHLKLRQQREKDHGYTHGQRSHNGSRHHHNRYNFHPWWSQQYQNWDPWVWHILKEAKRAPAKGFTLGIIATGSCLWIYDSNTFYMQQWVDFHNDLTQLKNHFIKNPAKPSAQPDDLLFSNPAAAIPVELKMLGGSYALLLSQGHYGAFLKHLKMLTPEEVELRLAQYQKSHRIISQQKKGRKNKSQKRSRHQQQQGLIQGYCVNQLSSNSPIEDDQSQHIVRDEDGEIERLFFGVFDGHSGWCCSQKVARELAPSVAKALDLVKDPADPKSVIEAIEQGFIELDQSIVQNTVKRVLEHPSRQLACSSLLPAISGSCALLAYVDVQERDLYVACVGDSRAVMGVRELLPDGTRHVWRAVSLSVDQTGRNRKEVKRLQAEHPGEEDIVVKRGRVLGGLEPTRAFGDARYKWTKDIQEKVFHLFPSYRKPYTHLITPPYVTAKPVVRHHKIQPNDRFMIMATDGLWDKLTSDEAVQLVGDLLDGKVGHHEMILDGEGIRKYKKQRKNAQLQQQASNAVEPTVNGGKVAVPEQAKAPQQQQKEEIEEDEQEEEEEKEEELTPLGTARKGPVSQNRKFTYRDQANASTHLIRNALGGADDDKVAATLSIPSPMSRAYRDDITVTVVFFEEQNTILALSDAKDSDGMVEIH
ncbi:hypothetical protein BX616_001754 [Lobosporangium transversale]|uniref:Phosphatase 2C-like domain-containing protein n=1 Tax=Lobosporangium transversale TaxID=64571 RepID=A0A1Y2GVV8_9FUNG|nr:phosphatase 2C-like domain-containing protein [Lobosporangium transversale]KAF9902951.1 hypothetical protein BX616_001754 [Lobosporangium transversale]ORZ26428.1 phosphatase 2C-like domain-containing protein [Lobosporangium transversale]|eukprot:XP_021884193.1 phosphatase 2C-like domain-containing protein [Lobosporangium transversale]